MNRLLKRLREHKDELLLVLKRPEVPLHTNGSERDIRGHVKKRKVTGDSRTRQTAGHPRHRPGGEPPRRNTRPPALDVAPRH
ncbi:TPA: transposase [Aeromonas veronii bv. veronii]|nr:transposase [Aeromonas veronii bv. veronii]